MNIRKKYKDELRDNITANVQIPCESDCTKENYEITQRYLANTNKNNTTKIPRSNDHSKAYRFKYREEKIEGKKQKRDRYHAIMCFFAFSPFCNLVVSVQIQICCARKEIQICKTFTANGKRF